MKKNHCERIFSRKLLSKEKSNRVYHLLPHWWKHVLEGYMSKQSRRRSCSLWMSSSHWYYSSYTCMVCTINSAGQARTRHDTSLGYLHLLAKEVDTNTHTETKTKEKERKKENGHVISQTTTYSQGLGLGWQHWDVLHIDQAIRLQILQAPTCQFRIFDQCQ